MQGVFLEELLAPRFIHVLCHLFIEDSLNEEEVNKHIGRERARIMANFEGRAFNEYDYDYDSSNEYGMSNDNVGGAYYSDEPLPYVTPLEPTEDGYPGLDPPMG